MRIQYDTNVRVVALANLEAMCKRVSGMCHRFEVSKVTPNRVYVTYSNPNEYGTESPMTAVLPCYPSGFSSPGVQSIHQSLRTEPFVILEILRVIGDTWNGEGWQAFGSLLECPQLWRDPNNGEWMTKAEIEAAQALKASEG
jgi:hypothetical protein